MRCELADYERVAIWRISARADYRRQRFALTALRWIK